jgi:hypothetical protein
MKSAMLAIVLSCAISGFADSDSSSAPSNKATGIGPNAFLIGINGLFNFNDFLGGSISYKHHFTSNKALRIGLYLTGNQTNDTASYSPSSSYSNTTDKNINGGGSLRAQFLYYPNPGSKVKLYYGGGPYVQGTYSKDIMQGRSGTETVRKSTISVGASLALGLEWLFASKFGLNIEYGLLPCYSWVENSDYGPTTYSKDDHMGGWRLSFDSLRFGLTIYL